MRFVMLALPWLCMRADGDDHGGEWVVVGVGVGMCSHHRIKQQSLSVTFLALFL